MLDRQTVPITFEQGVDSKSDPKSLSVGKLVSLQNAVFHRRKQLRKRNGYQVLPTAIMGGGSTFGRGAGLSLYQDELLLNDGTDLYSYNPSFGQWGKRGKLPPLTVRMTNLLRNNTDFVAQDMAYHPNGIGVVTAQGQTNGYGAGYVVFDWTTGNTLKDFTRVDYGPSGGQSKMKTVVLGKYIVVFYTDSNGHICFHAIDTSTAALTVTTYVYVIPWNGGGVSSQSPYWLIANIYDVCVNGNYALIAFNNGSGNITFGTLDTNLSFVTRQVFVASATNAITIFPYKQGGAIIAWSDDVGVFRLVIGAAPTFNITAGQGAVASVAPHCCQLAGIYDSVSDCTSIFATMAPLQYQAGTIYPVGAYVVSNQVGYSSIQNGSQGHDPATSPSWWQVDGSQYYVRRFLLLNGTDPYGWWDQRSVALAGKPFIIMGAKANIYVPLAFHTTQQSSYFLSLWPADQTGVNTSPTIVARWLYGLGGGVPNMHVLPEANVSDSNVFEMACLAKYSLSVDSSGASTEILTIRGVNRVTFDFSTAATQAVNELEAGKNLHISGGRLSMYDGSHVLEHGFHVYPENVFASPSMAGSAHQYQYVACYEWMDNQGNVHRSAPSPAITVQTATPIGAYPNAVTVYLPTLRLTDRNQNPTDMFGTVLPASLVVMLYRTVDNGSIFYALVPFDVAIQTPAYRNAVWADTLTITDSTSDAVLQGHSQLYTTGGVLENISPNPMGPMIFFSNRIIGIDSTNPLQLQRSQQIIPGSPVEFSDFLSLPIDPRGGDCTALAVLDEKLIVFKQENIFFLTGQGPDRTGNNDDMGSGQLLPADVGCIEPRSIVTIPSGVMFKSSKGIYLLDRSLSTSYVGADVEAYNLWDVTSAVLIPQTHAARFTLTNGTALHFDYILNQWSVFTNVVAVDAVIWQGLHTYLRSDGYVCQETPGMFVDPWNTYIPISLTTGWMALGALQGFQRVRRMLLLGDWKSAHSLQVQVSSAIDNFDNPLVQSATLAATTGPSQWQLSLKNQKCEAIQVSLTESGTTPGEGLALSSMLFEAGVKRGTARMPAARRY